MVTMSQAVRMMLYLSGYKTRFNQTALSESVLASSELSLKYIVWRVTGQIMFQGELQTRRNDLSRPL